MDDVNFAAMAWVQPFQICVLHIVFRVPGMLAGHLCNAPCSLHNGLQCQDYSYGLNLAPVAMHAACRGCRLRVPGMLAGHLCNAPRSLRHRLQDQISTAAAVTLHRGSAKHKGAYYSCLPIIICFKCEESSSLVMHQLSLQAIGPRECDGSPELPTLLFRIELV